MNSSKNSSSTHGCDDDTDTVSIDLHGDDIATQPSKHRDTTAALEQEVNDAVVWPYLALSISLWLATPTLIFAIVVAILLIGRIWTCVLFAIHLGLSLVKVRYHMTELSGLEDEQTQNTLRAQQQKNLTDTEQGQTPTSIQAPKDEPVVSKRKWAPFWFASLPSLMDIVFFGVLYPVIMMVFSDFFVDADGTLVVEWTYYYYSFSVLRTLGWIIVCLRICIGTRMIMSRWCRSKALAQSNALCHIPILGQLFNCCYSGWLRFKIWCSAPPQLIGWWHATIPLVTMALLFMSWAIFLSVLHLGQFGAETVSAPTDACDPLDATECILPFPSSYHMQPDPSTASGFRVNLRPESFPALKGMTPMPVGFLNNLDGYSTMGPLLFYLEGMKESHDAFVEDSASIKVEPGVTRLRGNKELHLSTTPYSTTLLLDVDQNELVAHSAEIDYLDSPRPLVMVFPAKPLRHNAHYALAVINATDIDGNRLPPTPGMVELFQQKQDPRHAPFTMTILPALEQATLKACNGTDHGWGGPFGAFVRSEDPEALQLLFDFRTISEQSQLGPVKAVRDATLTHLDTHWSWEDNEHVRVVKQIDGDCQDPGYPIARTIHAELDVPWFMTGFGPGHRGAKLDSKAVADGAPTAIGQAKVVIHVPCSLQQAALDASMTPLDSNTSPQPLRAVMEYGHGLFGHRLEAGDSYLIRLANENGYIIAGMDWRGMSKYDFPVLAKTMLTDPSLFESVRDNLIQGYANKFALQHFIHNGMLDKEWLQFSRPSQEGTDILHKIPQYVEPNHNETNQQYALINGQVPSVFYGNSQGGILGAGYVGLSGSTGFISRAVLGVPGTSFSFIMARSLAFSAYNIALLTNFYCGRHVRIFLSLAQMCWDSVEAAGVFAQPVVEEDSSVPPILIQTGLGDPIVPAVSAERLARALDAHTLEHNPRDSIFGVPIGKPGAHVTLQEILYQEDYEGLPESNKIVTGGHNWVHSCTRLDTTLQTQLVEFVNSGQIIDPCGEDGSMCVVAKARYPKRPMSFTDLFDTTRDDPGSQQIQYCEE